MAEIQNSFFYDGNQQYGEKELGVVFDTCFRSGVRVDDNGTLCYKVSVGNTAGTVIIEPGEALVGGRWRYDASAQTLNTTAASSNKRRDRVVIRTDYANKQTIVAIKQGTVSSNPQAPALQRDGTCYEISLATIEVSTTNHVSLVSDDRPNTELCGAVRARGPSEINEQIALMKETFDNMQTQFNAWFAQQQSEKGWRQMYIQGNEPESPVSGSIFVQQGADRDHMYYYDETGKKRELSIGMELSAKYFSSPFLTIGKNGWVTTKVNVYRSGWHPMGFVQLETFNANGGFGESWCTVYRQYISDAGNKNAAANIMVSDHFGSGNRRARIQVRFMILYYRDRQVL